MCFSAEASFTAATLLTISSAYGLTKVYKSDRKSFALIALIPLFFMIQQLMEGFIWLALEDKITLGWISLHQLSTIFLLFAYLIWPFWIPLSLAVFDRKKRRLFSLLTIVGFLLSIFLAKFVSLGFADINTRILNSSICHLPICTLPRHLGSIVYVSLVTCPFLIATWKPLRMFGVIFLISVILTLTFYNKTFISVWCFFSAILSLIICYLANLLPKKSN